MAKCRVYLFTYKRNHLFKRAVQSLIDQTFTDWVCEMHNDCPEDNFPGDHITTLGDNRFIIKNHPVRLGPTASFNLAYAGCEESYASILEDDNWWEAGFLEEMTGLMDRKPALNIAWSNMRIWQELPINEWEDTQNTIWPDQQDQTFNWPQPVQALGALHSNGAMIYRGSKAKNYRIPDSALFNAVELIRERSFEFPIYLVGKPLANFSRTLDTNQSNDSIKWTGTQVMMAASFIAYTGTSKEHMRDTLNYYRKARPSPIPVFFLAITLYIKNGAMLKHFNFPDWYLISRWCAANLFKLGRLKSYLRSQEETWQFLINHNPGNTNR